MDLYFSPLACSMACRIALDEASAVVRFIEVDPFTHQTLDDRDLAAITPMRLVPALVTDDGRTITENAAVLQYIASQYPDAKLAPRDPASIVKLQQWLSFVGTELHKVVFAPQFDRTASDAARAYALSKAPTRFDVLQAHLSTHTYLVDDFSVADAYLVTVLHWAQATPVDVSKWPAVAAYFARVRARPSVARSIETELPLYVAEQRRHKAA